MDLLTYMTPLSERARLRVLHACERHELSVVELCAVLQVPQSTASRHLKALVETGWLGARREGTSRYYRVERESLPTGARKLWKVIREQCEADPGLRDDDERLARVMRERQTRSQAFFAASATEWDRLREDLFGTHIEGAAFGALIDPSAVVGDLGCGTGKATEVLAQFARRVVAVDSSAAMIKAAQKRLAGRDNVEFHRADLERMRLGDDELDLGFLNLVLHHVADPGRVLQDVARVLKPGGTLVLVDMQAHDRAEYRQQMGHVWQGFSEPQLATWMRAAGLSPVRHVAWPPDPNAKGPPLFVATARA